MIWTKNKQIILHPHTHSLIYSTGDVILGRVWVSVVYRQCILHRHRHTQTLPKITSPVIYSTHIQVSRLNVHYTNLSVSEMTFPTWLNSSQIIVTSIDLSPYTVIFNDFIDKVLPFLHCPPQSHVWRLLTMLRLP
jgi:hypothetical protein